MVLFGLLATVIFGWGGAAVINSSIARKEKPIWIVFWRSIIAAPLLLLPLALGCGFHLSVPLMLLALASSVALFAAAFSYYAALGRGVASEVVVLSSTYPLIALVGLVVFWGQIPRPLALAGVVLVVSGALIFNLEGGKLQRPRLGGPFLLSLVAASAWGAWSIFNWWALHYASPGELYLWTSSFAFLLQGPVFLWSRKNGDSLRPGKESMFLLLGAVILTQTAIAAFYFALNSDEPAVAIAASAAYPLATQWILVASGREKLNALRLIATLMIVAGIAIARL